MAKLNYTVKELKAKAKAKGLTGYSRLRKAELIKLLGVGKKKPSSKKCASDKILNPASNRYVKKTGKIGRELLKGSSPKNPSPRPKSAKKCPKNKILNPTTGNCVLKTGAIGRKLGEKVGRYEKFKYAKWFIFTTEGCSSCTKAKNLLESYHIKYSTQRVDSYNDKKIYELIDPYTKKYKFFPVIFNNGKFIGGYTDLKEKIPK